MGQRSKIKIKDPPGSIETKLSLYLKTLKAEVISDLEKCLELWKEFSPQKTLFDTLEFRLAFYFAYKPKLHFVLLKSNSEKLGLLPLEYHEDKKKYFWFGTHWQEENKFFVKDPSLIPLLLSFAPKPVLLNAISFQSVSKIKNLVEFQKDDPKYVLNLEGLKSSEDYLMKLKKNRRRNLRKDRNRILKQNPKIIIDNFSDFENLVKLSRERFAQKGEEVDWKDERRVEAFKNVIKLAGRTYKIRMITVLIGGKIAGVDLNAIYNNCYYTLKCGYDVQNFSGIGNFLNLFEIDDAIRLGLKKIDFLQNSYHWKNKLFTPVPLLKYEKDLQNYKLKLEEKRLGL